MVNKKIFNLRVAEPKERITAKKAEGYVDSGVKILIAIVIGALLLASLYALFGNTIMPNVSSKIESIFDYSGSSGGENSEPQKIHFSIQGMGELSAQEGDTFDTWFVADAFDPTTNGIVWHIEGDNHVFVDASGSFILKDQTWQSLIQDGANYEIVRK